MVRLTTQQAEYLVSIFDGTYTEGLRDIVASVKEQLRAPDHTHDLLSTVAEALADPRGRGIGSTALDALRRSVLSPMELAKYQALLTRGNVCKSCGHELITDELCISHGRDFYCATCLSPEWVSCHSCSEPIDVSGCRRTIERARKKHTCKPRVEDPPADVDRWVVVSAPSPPDPPANPAAFRTIRPSDYALTNRSIRWSAIEDGTS